MELIVRCSTSGVSVCQHCRRRRCEQYPIGSPGSESYARHLCTGSLGARGGCLSQGLCSVVGVV